MRTLPPFFRPLDQYKHDARSSEKEGRKRERGGTAAAEGGAVVGGGFDDGDDDDYGARADGRGDGRGGRARAEEATVVCRVVDGGEAQVGQDGGVRVQGAQVAHPGAVGQAGSGGGKPLFVANRESELDPSFRTVVIVWLFCIR